ncbi:MAG: hypothetical protein WDZ42_02430 [Candidatus Saccharimonadales bacterium]
MKIQTATIKPNLAIAIVAAYALIALFVHTAIVFAAPDSTELTISDPRPGATATYTLSLTGLSETDVEAVELSLEDGTVGSFDNGSSTATTGTWTDDSSVSDLKATTTTAAALTDGDIIWTGVTNPAAGNYTATFTSYENSDYTGEVDTVSLNFAIVEGQQVSLTVDPTFSFTVAAVSDSESVNGATTTATTTSTTIPFGQVEVVANGIAAQDLTINTNAQSGYNIYTRYTGQLTSGSNTIADHSGTNASPTSFTSAGTESFGYTTEDQFGSNLWAGLTTSNETVASNNSSLSSAETTRVGFQAGIAADTPAGTYTTTVIYTAVPTY